MNNEQKKIMIVNDESLKNNELSYFFKELKIKIMNSEYQLSFPPFILIMNNWSHFNE